MFSFDFRSLLAPRRSPPSTGARPPLRCFHCDQPLPTVVRDWVSFDGARRPLCCAACAAVAQTVIDCGYASHYRARVIGATTGEVDVGV